VENKGELIDCLTKQHCRKPGSDSLAAVTHRRHSLKHGKYGGDGSQDVPSKTQTQVCASRRRIE